MRSNLTSWGAAIVIALMTVACSQTDTGITTAVKAKLAADDEVKAYQINVDTESNIVTLSGTVDTAAAKTRAVELARATEGVKSVTDRLVVSGAIASTPMSDAARATYTDPAITAAVKGKLLADPAVGGLKIDVDTRDGIVTLSGQVRTQAERDQALQLTRDTSGVRSVEDKLMVVP
jgi:hyperosmotically inducible periplasmic protein